MRAAVVSLLMAGILATGCTLHRADLAVLATSPRAATGLGSVQGESCFTVGEWIINLLPPLWPLGPWITLPHLELAIRDALGKSSGANALVDVSVDVVDGCYRVEGLAVSM